MDVSARGLMGWAANSAFSADSTLRIFSSDILTVRGHFYINLVFFDRNQGVCLTLLKKVPIDHQALFFFLIPTTARHVW